MSIGNKARGSMFLSIFFFLKSFCSDNNIEIIIRIAIFERKKNELKIFHKFEFKLNFVYMKFLSFQIGQQQQQM